jgi:hypothetical protein
MAKKETITGDLLVMAKELIQALADPINASDICSNYCFFCGYFQLGKNKHKKDCLVIKAKEWLDLLK